MNLLTDQWKEYELLDASDGEKLERWNNVILRRPDPQIIWTKEKSNSWSKVDAHYFRSKSGGGKWDFKNKIPKRWTVSYRNLKFYVEPTGFKHTGLFPEQAVNWDFIMDKISNAKRKIKVLNLFAYTGGATVAAAYAGADVCHVDAAKGMVNWAKENVSLSNLSDKKVRYIVDDVVKFVKKEQRRGNKYDAIIMDPPSYGRGPSGEMWKIEEELYSLINECTKILSDEPLFLLVNSYTTGFSPIVISNILKLTVGRKYEGKITSGEVSLPCKELALYLPCGIYGRFEGY